jgi:hypothetical protein
VTDHDKGLRKKEDRHKKNGSGFELGGWDGLRKSCRTVRERGKYIVGTS